MYSIHVEQWFFMKIENTVYTSFLNSTFLVDNGFIFDIINIQNNQSLEFEWIPMLEPLRSVNEQRFSWLCLFKIGWTLQKMLARKCLCCGKHMKDLIQALIKSLKPPNFFFDISLSMYWENTFVKIFLKTSLVGKDLYDRGKIIQVWLTLDIKIMLLEIKNISNQSLMLMLLKWHDCLNWRATSTSETLKRNGSLNVNLE